MNAMNAMVPVDNGLTSLLNEWMRDDGSGGEHLFECIYPELHRIASRLFASERAGNLLQPTSVVNELFLRLVRGRDLRYEDRQHFFRLAARLMRRILIDHARGEKRQKRDARMRVPLTDDLHALVADDLVDPVDLDAVLRELEAQDAEKLRMVELRFFLGFTAIETAELMDISKAKVDRDLRFVRSWMKMRLLGIQDSHPAP